MAITDITWEEFETYDKVDAPDNYDFRIHGGKYYTFEEFGIASVRRVFEIDPLDFKDYLSGKRSAREINFKAQNNYWPPTEEEKRASEKRSVEKSPTTLIDVPRFRTLFTQEELERLIPIAEKQWIDWKGKLPDGYVSPLGDGNGSSDIEWGNQDSEVSDETFIEFLRENPSASLQNPEIAQKLFSPEEFTTLIREAVTVELEPQKIDSMGLVDGHLELLLLDPIGWQEELEGAHLELLQEKLNNYLYFIESKQYAERYGDQFDKKVINLTFQYSPSDKGLAFLAAAQKTLSPTDIRLKIVLPDE